jgi:hypothetical protein
MPAKPPPGLIASDLTVPRTALAVGTLVRRSPSIPRIPFRRGLDINVNCKIGSDFDPFWPCESRQHRTGALELIQALGGSASLENVECPQTHAICERARRQSVFVVANHFAS